MRRTGSASSAIRPVTRALGLLLRNVAVVLQSPFMTKLRTSAWTAVESGGITTLGSAKSATPAVRRVMEARLITVCAVLAGYSISKISRSA